MKATLLFNQFAPVLAQVAGGLAEGARKAMDIVMLIGFIFGTICVVGGGFAIRRGDTDSDMLSIIVGLIIAGAPVTQAELCERVWQRDHESAGARLRSSLPGCAEK